MPTEADTCRTYVLPALYGAGWTDEQIREQVSFTPGRIIVAGGTVRRGSRKRVDYLLSYLRDRPLAVVEAILKGKRRVLLTLATGTGKTVVAFQICWRLWSTNWNRTGEFRKPRILYLADRNVLVDDPKDKIFAPFGDARHKISGGDARKG